MTPGRSLRGASLAPALLALVSFGLVMGLAPREASRVLDSAWIWGQRILAVGSVTAALLTVALLLRQPLGTTPRFRFPWSPDGWLHWLTLAVVPWALGIFGAERLLSAAAEVLGEVELAQRGRIAAVGRSEAAMIQAFGSAMTAALLAGLPLAVLPWRRPRARTALVATALAIPAVVGVGLALVGRPGLWPLLLPVVAALVALSLSVPAEGIARVFGVASATLAIATTGLAIAGADASELYARVATHASDPGPLTRWANRAWTASAGLPTATAALLPLLWALRTAEVAGRRALAVLILLPWLAFVGTDRVAARIEDERAHDAGREPWTDAEDFAPAVFAGEPGAAVDVLLGPGTLRTPDGETLTETTDRAALSEALLTRATQVASDDTPGQPIGFPSVLWSETCAHEWRRVLGVAVDRRARGRDLVALVKAAAGARIGVVTFSGHAPPRAADPETETLARRLPRLGGLLLRPRYAAVGAIILADPEGCAAIDPELLHARVGPRAPKRLVSRPGGLVGEVPLGEVAPRSLPEAADEWDDYAIAWLAIDASARATAVLETLHRVGERITTSTLHATLPEAATIPAPGSPADLAGRPVAPLDAPPPPLEGGVDLPQPRLRDDTAKRFGDVDLGRSRLGGHSAVGACVRRALARERAGPIALRLRIDRRGKVEAGRVQRATVDAPALGRCLLQVAATWRYPALRRPALLTQWVVPPGAAWPPR